VFLAWREEDDVLRTQPTPQCAIYWWKDKLKVKLKDIPKDILKVKLKDKLLDILKDTTDITDITDTTDTTGDIRERRRKMIMQEVIQNTKWQVIWYDSV